MTSVNKFIGIGNLTKDPAVRYLSSGEAVANITIACNESWKDKNGEKQEKVEYIRVTFYRKLAEIAGKYLKKGSSIYIEGRLETRKWTDKNGVDRYTTDIIATDMKMLGSKGGGHEAPDNDVNETKRDSSDSEHGFEDMDSDIPF